MNIIYVIVYSVEPRSLIFFYLEKDIGNRPKIYLDDRKNKLEYNYYPFITDKRSPYFYLDKKQIHAFLKKQRFKIEVAVLNQKNVSGLSYT